MDKWILVKYVLPENNKVVDTKIDDEKGLRNEQQLKRLNHLWFNPDGLTYVYYTPTHWKSISPPKTNKQ